MAESAPLRIPVRVPVLSVIELVMAMEEVFGLSVPDEKARRVSTIGDMKRCVREMVPAPAVTPVECPTQHAFYALRRAVVSALGVPRQAVRPHILSPPSQSRECERPRCDGGREARAVWVEAVRRGENLTPRGYA